jgi:hypothetical protein
MKTKKEIQKEIKYLKSVRPKIRPRSIFGTNNLAILDAMIDVLENNLGNNEIFDRYEGTQEGTLIGALDARSWLDGRFDGRENPLRDWPMIDEEN